MWGAELRQGLVPLFSAQLQGGINEQQADMLTEMDTVQWGVRWVGWVLGPVGAVGLLVSVWLGVRWGRAVKGGGVSVGARNETVGERARLKVGGSGGRVWYGQAPQEVTEIDEDETHLDEEEEPEERIRIGYR